MHAWVHSTNKLQYIKVLDSFLSSDSINTEEYSRWIIQKYKQYLEMNNRPIIDHLSDDDKLSTLTQKKAKLTRFGTQLKADYLSNDNTIDTVSFPRVPISFIKRFPHFRKKKLFVYKFFPSTRIKTRKYARPSEVWGMRLWSITNVKHAFSWALLGSWCIGVL